MTTSKQPTPPEIKELNGAISDATKNKRKRKPTPFIRSKKLVDEILHNIEGGLSNDAACILAGTTETSFYRWRRCEEPLSDEELDGIEPEEATKEDRRCYDCAGCNLHSRMRKAENKFEQRHLQKIDDAANAINDKTTIPNWEASSWLLERKFKSKYAKRSVNDVNASIDAGSENANKLAASILRGAIAGVPNDEGSS